MNSSPQHHRTDKTLVRLVAIRLLSLVAAGLAGYLAYVSFQTGGPAGCGGEVSWINCEHVLTTRWSGWFAIPVSLLAAACYLGIFITSWLAFTSREWRLPFHTLVLCAGVAAIWFVGLQAIVLQQFCLYCLATHFCGLVILPLTLSLGSLSRKPEFEKSWQWLHRPLVLALTGFAILVTGQLMYQPQEFQISDDPGEPIKRDFVSYGSMLQPKVDVDEEANIAGKSATTADALSPALKDATAANASDVDSGSPIDLASANSVVSEDVIPSNLERPTDIKVDVAPSSPFPVDLEKNPPATDIAGANEPARLIRFPVGGDVIDVYRHPLIGKPDADEIFVEFFDYGCPKCRQLHAQLMNFKDVAPYDFGIVLIVVPMNTACNPYIDSTHQDHLDSCDYARLSLAIWEAKPDRFVEFHDWLMTGLRPPSIDRAVEMARQKFGVTDINERMVSPRISQFLKHHVDLYHSTGQGKVPRLHVGNRNVVGVPSDQQQLFNAIERMLKSSR